MSRLPAISAAALVTCLAVPTIADDDASPRLLDHDTFMQMESIRGVDIAPDGSEIIFSRSRVDQKADRYTSNLWMANWEGTRIRELTHGPWRDGSPVWSPDGTKLAFISDRDGSSQIHVMWMDTREVAQLTHVERGPGSIRWSPDGKTIAFTMFVPDQEPALKVKLPAAPEGASRARGAIVVDRLTWQRDGRGYLPPGQTHVFTIDAIVGGTERQITSGEYSHSDPRWSADGKTLYVSAIRKPDWEYLRGDSEIYAVDLDSLEVMTLTDREGPDRGARVSPDGEWIAYTGYDQQNFTSHLSSLHIMRPDGSENRIWATGLPNSPSGVEWAADSSGVYFRMGAAGHYNLYFVPLNGGVRAVTKGAQVLDSVSIADNGRVAATRSSFHQPGDLVVFTTNDAGRLRSLVDLNSDVLDGVTLGAVEEIWFESSDGLDIQGWLMKPAQFEEQKKYPLLLWIHGGPWSMYSASFNWAWQNFAAQGYGVLYTNPRGSTGYGQDFVNGIQFSYPGRDFDDLMAGVDAAIDTGWIDERNLFVCGGSGGGVLTAWIVGHTNRFRAAVSMRPVINWHSFVGTTDGPSWYHQFRRFPWEDPLEYAQRSPLHYVANVTTPTMVMTGEADLRTPMTQSEEYYRALKMLKKDTLLVRMPEEYHGWRRPSHRLLQQLYLQAWFEKYRAGYEESEEAGAE